MLYDVAVIGGGPGGYVAAIRAAQLGGRVALVERDELGGTCLNRGCIPTKALVQSAEVLETVRRAQDYGIKVGDYSVDMSRVMERKNGVVKQLVAGLAGLMAANRIDLFRSEGTLVAPGRVRLDTGDEIHSRSVILATGSAPAAPPVEGLDLPEVITSDEALEMREMPGRVVIVGGGVIGIEFACVFRAFGSEVWVVEMLPLILPPADEELARRLTPLLRKSGISILTGTRLKRVDRTPEGLQVVVESGDAEERMAADLVLVAAGRKPDFGGQDLGMLGIEHDRGGIRVDGAMRTSLPGVYAVGDVTGGLMLAHVASAEGIVAAENAMGREKAIDYSAVPNCIFSSPEVAGVGLTEKGARERGIDVRVGKFPYAASGKALALGKTDGLVKLIAESGAGRILGVHIMGAHATELIHEGVVAVKAGLTASELAEMIHAHPTLSEATGEAAHAALGSPIHFAVRKTREV